MTQTQNIKPKHNIFRILAIATMVFLVPLGTALGQQQAAPLQMELPPADIPQPQLFCGYCHVLTYPGVVQKGYNLWKKAKHNKFGCVECHYPPREVKEHNPVAPTTAETKTSHIPQKPPERFSYLPLGG